MCSVYDKKVTLLINIDTDLNTCNANLVLYIKLVLKAALKWWNRLYDVFHSVSPYADKVILVRSSDAIRQNWLSQILRRPLIRIYKWHNIKKSLHTAVMMVLLTWETTDSRTAELTWLYSVNSLTDTDWQLFSVIVDLPLAILCQIRRDRRSTARIIVSWFIILAPTVVAFSKTNWHAIGDIVEVNHFLCWQLRGSLTCDVNLGNNHDKWSVYGRHLSRR